MEIEEYKSNSFKSREKESALPEKKVEKVISGTAKTQKKNEIQKFADVFISEDVSNVKSYILLDVLVPAVKKAISDIVTNGIDMILYGEAGKSRKSNSASKVSYRQYYDDRDTDRRRSSTSSRGFDYDNILFETRGDAEAVLDAMNDIINSQYQVVSVADLYDLANMPCDNFNANKYGWYDLSGCKAIRVKDGYVLRLPKALPLN